MPPSKVRQGSAGSWNEIQNSIRFGKITRICFGSQTMARNDKGGRSILPALALHMACRSEAPATTAATRTSATTVQNSTVQRYPYHSCPTFQPRGRNVWAIIPNDTTFDVAADDPSLAVKSLRILVQGFLYFILIIPISTLHRGKAGNLV